MTGKARSLLESMDLGKIEERALLALLSPPLGIRDAFLRTVKPDPFTVTGRMSHIHPNIDPFVPRLRDQYTVTKSMPMKDDLLDSKKLARLIADIKPDMLQRQRLMHDEMVRKTFYSDTRSFEELTIGEHLRRARQIIGQTLRECQNPRPETPSGKVESRLAKTLRLIWYHETLDDMAHDLGLDPPQHSIRDLEKLWNDGVPYRGYERRKSDIVGTFCRRFVEEMQFMRRLMSELEMLFEGPRNPDDEYDNHFYELVIGACFGAALSLEANFEDRFYAEEASAAV